MNYFQKNRKNIIIGVIATLLVAALVALWLQREVLHSDSDIEAVVFPDKLLVGDSLKFSDKTSFGKFKKWDFGDGTTSEKNDGVHFYTKSGYYVVSLVIDNKYTKSFNILVNDKAVARPKDSATTTKIDAQTQAMQYENVQFRAISDATQFTWRFGETGKIDAKEQMAIYSFQKPGTYTVTLYTEKDLEPVQHQIKILEAYNSMNDEEPSLDEQYAKKDNDFKYHLQQIANGNSFNMHYNYLLRTYLCNNENAIVQVTDSKVNNFYLYCAGLQFDKNIIIQTVKLNFNENMNCVTKVEINQSK